jgi:hypothetical protein
LLLDRVLGERAVWRVDGDGLYVRAGTVSQCLRCCPYAERTHQAQKARHGCGGGLDLAVYRREAESMRRESAHLAGLG